MEKGQRERQLLSRHPALAGVDEVGRGCIAGPVFAAAVILDYQLLFALPPHSLGLLRDSKTLSKNQRQEALTLIDEVSVCKSIGRASVADIEGIGILNATFLAMRRALASLEQPPDFVLVDGNQKIRDIDWEQEAIIGGDGSCFSIAAASIVAKCARDQFMTEMSATYPQFGFERHVGYGTKAHLESITRYGICDLHRRNFAPIRNFSPS